MKYSIIILLISTFYSCKNKPNSCVILISSKDGYTQITEPKGCRVGMRLDTGVSSEAHHDTISDSWIFKIRNKPDYTIDTPMGASVQIDLLKSIRKIYADTNWRYPKSKGGGYIQMMPIDSALIILPNNLKAWKKRIRYKQISVTGGYGSLWIGYKTDTLFDKVQNPDTTLKSVYTFNDTVYEKAVIEEYYLSYNMEFRKWIDCILVYYHGIFVRKEVISWVAEE